MMDKTLLNKAVGTRLSLCEDIGANVKNLHKEVNRSGRLWPANPVLMERGTDGGTDVGLITTLNYQITSARSSII